MGDLKIFYAKLVAHFDPAIKLFVSKSVFAVFISNVNELNGKTFVTDSGITFTWHPEAGKPFVTDMIGQLAVLFLFASSMSAISALVFYGKDEK